MKNFKLRVSSLRHKSPAQTESRPMPVGSGVQRGRV